MVRRPIKLDTLKLKILNNDTVIIYNKNTTIGYACFNIDEKILEYIYVNPSFRRRGIGSELLSAAEKLVKNTLQPAGPVSPLGDKFFSSKSF
jgi:GNAT superfamily N-acetyltransferase